MDEVKWYEVEQWLERARRDLASAKLLLEGDPPYKDSAVYHCQQAAEKALKGYLASKDKEIEKTHDLLVLVMECMGLDTDFESYRTQLKC